MSRPFFNDTIAKLEAAFEARKTDKDFLHILFEELSFRSTDKAKKLRLRVIELIDDTVSGSRPPKKENATKQADKLPTLSIDDYQHFIIKPNMNTSFTNQPSNILSAWIALEVLSPQTFRKPFFLKYLLVN